MCFQPDGAAALPVSELWIGAAAVPWVNVYKYLGIELHAGVPFRQYRHRAAQSATRAAYAVSGMGMYSGKLGVPLGLQVYKAMVRPLLEYCSEVSSITPWPAAEALQLSMAKRILACSSRTSSEAARGELGLMRMEARYQQARVCFWGKLHTMPADSPARRVFEAGQLYYALSEAGDERMPAVSASEGWAVQYVQPVERGLTLWSAQLKADLYQLGMEAQYRDPTSGAGARNSRLEHRCEGGGACERTGEMVESVGGELSAAHVPIGEKWPSAAAASSRTCWYRMGGGTTRSSPVVAC